MVFFQRFCSLFVSSIWSGHYLIYTLHVAVMLSMKPNNTNYYGARVRAKQCRFKWLRSFSYTVSRGLHWHIVCVWDRAILRKSVPNTIPSMRQQQNSSSLSQFQFHMRLIRCSQILHIHYLYTYIFKPNEKKNSFLISLHAALVLIAFTNGLACPHLWMDARRNCNVHVHRLLLTCKQWNGRCSEKYSNTEYIQYIFWCCIEKIAKEKRWHTNFLLTLPSGNKP